MTNAAEGNIMTVSELIDSAFGDPQINIVNHKHIQTVLHLLARQLRVLERRILVKISSEALGSSETTLSVTELKLQAMTKKKKKGARQKSDTKILSDVNEMGSKSNKSAPTKAKTGKESSSEQKASSLETSTDKTSTDKTSTDKTSTDKTSSAKTSSAKSSNGKTSTDKTSSDKTSTDKTSASKTEPSTSLSDEKSRDLQDYQTLLDTVEETREREMREIRQRVNSREERDKTPTPMASMDSVEATIEKLLVVERVSIEEANARARGKLSGATESRERLSIVTKDQFEELVNTVEQLQAKFRPIPLPEMPENAQLMQDLRKGASLTNAMAALQLSARLEATEKTLENILSLVTDLATEIGVELKESSSNVPESDNIQVIFGGEKDKKHLKKAVSSKSSKKLKIDSIHKSDTHSSEVKPPNPVPNEEIEEATKDKVTYEELDTALQEVSENILKTVNDLVLRSNTNAANAMRLANQLDVKIKKSLDMGTKMVDLESLVANYTEQVNQLDTGLSSQMTNYQEELSQMQHSLEVGLENMAEMMANTGGDAMAVAELNTHFNDLQTDIDTTAIRQRDLGDVQNTLSEDLESLRKQIEMLRETKSDRDEVADALQDKAGLGDLNGLVANEQFLAVLVDFEKRIEMAYDKFNHQEVTWQKAIDDLVRCLNEKADQIQVDTLRDSVEHYLEVLKGRVKFIADIVGEPSAAAVARMITRDQACLSCSTPAHIKIEQATIPVLPAFRPPAVGAETPKEDGDHGSCYPGYPIPHPVDPRAHTCNRWCGGSHTIMTHTSRVPPSFTIRNLERTTTMERGTDGKMYAVDAQLQVREPCSQCLTQSAGPRPSEAGSTKPEDPTDGASYIMCDECLIGSITPPFGI